MLKKSITYEDFNGEKVTEDFYFHLSKADIVEMEISHKEGLQAWLQSLVDAQDGEAIFNVLKNIILTSYGMKSPDGRRFVKNAQLIENFQSTEAYSTLIFELCTDAGKAAAFVEGIIPAGLEAEVAALQAQNTVEAQSKPVSPEADPTAIEAPAPQVLTMEDIVKMDPVDLQNGLKTGRYQL